MRAKGTQIWKNKKVLLSRDEVHQALCARHNPDSSFLLDVRNDHAWEVRDVTENPGIALIPKLPCYESDHESDNPPRGPRVGDRSGPTILDAGETLLVYG